MGRNYAAHYLRLQQSRYNSGRTPAQISWTDGVQQAPLSGPPEGFREVIMEWLDQNLSPLIKRAISFDKNSQTNHIPLQTDPDLVDARDRWRARRSGTLFFGEETVEVICHSTDLHVTVEYAHPQLFEILQTALSKFFNGCT